MEFRKILKGLRIEKGLSQMEVASGAKTSQATISAWELGKTEPTASALIKLSAFFGEKTDFLLGLED